MKKFYIGAVALVIISAILIVVGCTIYNISIGPVSKNDEIKVFKVSKGDTYSTLGKILKEKKLIKSEFSYKFYIKLMRPKKLEVGSYNLKENMGVAKIVEQLSGNVNDNTITITIPEGKHLAKMAEIISEETNNSAESLLTVWNSKEFVDEVIKNYWFVTDDVKKSGIRYPLEGYFFPSTYELSSKDVDPKYIAFKLLDQMDIILTKYKKEINNSKLSVHELLTLASIIQYEGILDEDLADISGVFYNRLSDDMKLQSCATLGYAIDNFKLTYNYKDMDVDSPYNTYKNNGLPIGPGGMPGEKSIKAAIYPNKHDYYYFMANVCDVNDSKTYFSKTLKEHEQKVNKYLTCM